MGGSNKLLLPLQGKPILAHCLEYFQSHPLVCGLVLSAAPDQVETYRELARSHRIEKLVGIAPGGAERQDSIRNALAEIPGAAEDAVGIHDAARPVLSQELLPALVAALADCDGSLPMVAVKDTIKRVAEDGQVLQTLVRSELFAAQTPQVFRLGVIRDAHRRAAEEGFVGTDDCSLIERYGGRIRKVEGNYRNVKVTTPEDVWVLERFLELAHG